MRELRFDGLSPDGSRLVLAGKDGQKYTVVIDERLEAAVRRDRARIGQVEIEQAGVLRPREIQARIRAGATAEDVAAASGLPLEHIRRFEGPVLTERAWVAEQAQSTEVRRPGGDIELGDLVAERLAAERVDPADISWDAWRRDDGLWVVIATFPVGQNVHVATWTYDSGSRTMTVADDNAEALSTLGMDEPLTLVAARPTLTSVAPLEQDDEDEPAAIIRPLAHPSTRPAAPDGDADEPLAVVDEIEQDEDDLDEDESAEQDAVELAEDLAALEGEDPAEAIEVLAELEDLEEASDEGPTGLADPEEIVDELAEPEVSDEDVESEDGAEAGAGSPEAGADDQDPGEGGPTADAEDLPLFDTPAPAPSQRSGRPPVPSFDDILFGPGPQR
jgi:hypothetical protein